MAFTTPNLSLEVWNQVTDPYDHQELAENWAKVDEHDHSAGKGLQIPTGGIADGAVTAAKIAPGAVPDLTVDDGAITTAKLADDSVATAKIQDAAVTAAKLAGGLALPTGATIPYAGSGAPSGWLLCDGTSYSTATYSDLFGVIGTAYGSGAGTFNVPDFRGRVAVGVGTHSDVSSRGKEENPVVSVGSRTPYHQHDPGTLEVDSGSDIGSGAAYDATPLTGSTATETPPFVTVNWIIKT